MRPLTPTCTLLGMLVLAGTSQAADEGQVVFQADFEQDAAASPPAGWSMWGAEAFKDPANFTRDSTDPHSGQGCLRIHHPADTAGYLVTAPDRAVRAKEGMRYEVSFWARADKPGPAPFYWTAYESIAPFVDAPSPGRWTLGLATDWREFRFTIR